MKRTIGIIGYGNIGSAIAQRIKSEYPVWAFDKDKHKTKNLLEKLDINLAADIIDLLSKVDTVILAIKPQDFGNVLRQIKEYIKEKLVISIAAGISTGYIENQLGKLRIIRVMPNLPVKVGKGMICLSKGNFAGDYDLDFVKKLFDCLGQTMLIEEDLMNAATAISGSGPGYFYHLIQGKHKKEWEDYASNVFIPRLFQVAQVEEIGFSPQQARMLADATAAGSIALLRQTALSPRDLCRQVTSKGGTTEAGLRLLHSIDDLQASAIAALKRAEELSQ